MSDIFSFFQGLIWNSAQRPDQQTSDKIKKSAVMTEQHP